MAARPNNLTRAIIDVTVDRGLKEIGEDPQRSIRKLTDMGRQFNRGRFMDEIYAIVQELLRNENCPFYTAFEHLLRFTSRKNLKEFGINIGYNSLTFGAKKIRETEEKSHYLIPWSIVYRMDDKVPGSVSVERVAGLIDQGKKIGIYTYIFCASGSPAQVSSLFEMFAQNPDCAFLCFLEDVELDPQQLSLLKNCMNMLLLMPGGTENTCVNIQNLKKQKSLYGIYGSYSDETCGEWTKGDALQNLERHDAAFVVMRPSSLCSEETIQEMSTFVKSMRTKPVYPFFLFDYYSDISEVGRICSSRQGFLEILENGSVNTINGITGEIGKEKNLEQILREALPFD